MYTGDEAALIRAICETPHDVTPRLVYADWLDEHGQADRADMIRNPVRWFPSNRRRGAWFERTLRALCGVPRWCRLSCHDAVECWGWMDDIVRSRRHVALFVDDGFVEMVNCCEHFWYTNGPRIVACQPVTEVSFSKRPSSPRYWLSLPATALGRSCWVAQDIPRRPGANIATPLVYQPFFDEMVAAGHTEHVDDRSRVVQFEDDDQACCALSDAALRWARKAAGLTPDPHPEPAAIAA